MNLKQFQLKDMGTSWLFLATAAFFSITLLGADSFPHLGWALVLAISATLVYLFKRERSNWLTFLYVATLSLSFFIFFRAQPFLTFINSLAVIYLGSMMLSLTKGQGFLEIAASPVTTFFRSLVVPHSYMLFTKSAKNESAKKLASNNLFSIFITLGVLAIIIPLLASANPIFAQWVFAITDILSLENLVDVLFNGTDHLVVYTLGFIFFAFIIPRFLVFSNREKKPLIHIVHAVDFSLFIPKIAVSVVLLIFFVSQAQLYFADAATLQSLGYTSSQYAREVFGQLFVVGTIILWLLYNERSTDKKSQQVTILLLIEALFLTLIGLKSVTDYSLLWGLTTKRLWGFTGVIWMTGAFGSYIYWQYRRLDAEFYVKSICALSAAVLILINLANFDWLITRYQPHRGEPSADYEYLTSLSADAGIYRALYDQLGFHSVDINHPDLFTIFTIDDIARDKLAEQIKYLQWKYQSDIKWRSFNWSEYAEYQRVKDIVVPTDIPYVWFDESIETQQ